MAHSQRFRFCPGQFGPPQNTLVQVKGSVIFEETTLPRLSRTGEALCHRRFFGRSSHGLAVRGDGLRLVTALSPATMQAVRAFGTPTVVHFLRRLTHFGGPQRPVGQPSQCRFRFGYFRRGGTSLCLSRLSAMLDASPVMLPTPRIGCGTPFSDFRVCSPGRRSVRLLHRLGASSCDCCRSSAPLLLFVGIHTSWDSVTLHVTIKQSRVTEKKKKIKRKNSSKPLRGPSLG